MLQDDQQKAVATKSHKTNKFVMGVKGGWFLMGKPNQTGQPNAFICPFLDASKVTQTTTLTLRNLLV